MPHLSLRSPAVPSVLAALAAGALCLAGLGLGDRSGDGALPTTAPGSALSVGPARVVGVGAPGSVGAPGTVEGDEGGRGAAGSDGADAATSGSDGAGADPVASAPVSLGVGAPEGGSLPGSEVRTLARSAGSGTVAAATWDRAVRTVGDQEQIDACTGPVLVERDRGTLVAEHNHCGGNWILQVRLGDVVELSGVIQGRFLATAEKDVPRGSDSRVLADIPGALYLQTCRGETGVMRVVALEPVG